MNREDLEQEAVFIWAGYNLSRYPMLRWLHAIPSGGYRPVPTAVKLKRTGVIRGILDILLPYPSHSYHFLAIEMKIYPNKPSLEQLEYINFLNANGYRALVCYSAEEAIEAIEEYLGT